MGMYDNIRDSFWNKIETSNDQYTLKIRAKYQERWMKLSNTDDPTKIDLTNPIVNLEFFLADFRIIARLTGGKRDEVLAMMTETQR